MAMYIVKTGHEKSAAAVDHAIFTVIFRNFVADLRDFTAVCRYNRVREVLSAAKQRRGILEKQ